MDKNIQIYFILSKYDQRYACPDMAILVIPI